jgi:hypothetical protein
MQIQTQHIDLHAAISTFCAANGISKSAFGLQAIGDPSLMRDLERGRELRSGTVRKIQQFIAKAKVDAVPISASNTTAAIQGGAV